MVLALITTLPIITFYLWSIIVVEARLIITIIIFYYFRMYMCKNIGFDFPKLPVKQAEVSERTVTHILCLCSLTSLFMLLYGGLTLNHCY